MFYSLSTVGNICNTVASLRLVSPSATTDGVALFVSLKTDDLLSSAVFSVNSAAKKINFISGVTPSGWCYLGWSAPPSDATVVTKALGECRPPPRRIRIRSPGIRIQDPGDFRNLMATCLVQRYVSGKMFTKFISVFPEIIVGKMLKNTLKNSWIRMQTRITSKMQSILLVQRYISGEIIMKVYFTSLAEVITQPTVSVSCAGA